MSDVKQVNGKSGRHYETPAGTFPSVTTILSATKSQRDREALQRWRESVGEEEANRISRQSTADGSLLHSCIEGMVSWEDGVMTDLGGVFIKIASDNNGADKERVSRLFNIWNQHIRPRVGQAYMVEKYGWNERHGYAGAIDYYGEFDGIPSVVDWKNSNKEKQEAWITDYKLQGAAYIGIASRCPSFTAFPPPQQFVCCIMNNESDEPQVFRYSLNDIIKDIWPLWELRCKAFHHGDIKRD
jgi:genome maintenance exonuclease 1